LKFSAKRRRVRFLLLVFCFLCAPALADKASTYARRLGESRERSSGPTRAELSEPRCSFHPLLLATRAEDPPVQAQHDYTLDGLTKAIRNGGDGSTAETGYKVISVREEYAVCRMAGWQLKGRALVHEGGEPFDLFQVVDRAGVERKVYFDIGSFFGKR
jgi:hypothetical protein